MEFTNFLEVWFVFLTNANQANEMSSRPSNSVIVALYRDTNCCVEANDAITGVLSVGIPMKIRRLVAPPRACFKVKIEACKLFAKFVHSPFGRLIHTFINSSNLTIYYKCCLSISTLYYNFSKPRGTPVTVPTLQAGNYTLWHPPDFPLVKLFYRPRGCINEAFWN